MATRLSLSDPDDLGSDIVGDEIDLRIAEYAVALSAWRAAALTRRVSRAQRLATASRERQQILAMRSKFGIE